VQQHWLQLACAFVSLLECFDCSGVLGIHPYWVVGLLSSLGGSFVAMILEVSGYVLALGHYALIREHPRWLAPLFTCIAMGYTLIHVPLQTIRGLDGRSGFAFADSMTMAVTIATTLTIIDVIFFRIRRHVIESDTNAASSAKMLPRLMKVGRIVAALNVVLIGATAYAVTNNINPNKQTPAPQPGTYTPALQPLIRLVILLVTMWWTFHRPCPSHLKAPAHKQLSSRNSTKRSTVTKSSTESRPDHIEPSSPPLSTCTSAVTDAQDSATPAGSPRVSTCVVEMAPDNNSPNSISVEIVTAS
jgi:hypothetical protein